MKPKLILCLALVLSFVFIGCETENIEKNHFSVTNLNGDGRTETHTNSFGIDEHTFADGKALSEFPLDNHRSCWLVLFYPTNQLNQISEWQIDSWQVCAWLLRTQLDGRGHSESLYGKIKVGEFDWRHKNRRYVAFDLTSTNGFALKGEFNSYDQTKFDANQLWLVPYLIIVGPFVNW